MDSSDIKTGTLTFRYHGDDAGQVEMLRRLVMGNVKIASFREVPLSLEDAFMALSGMMEPDGEDKSAPPRQDGQRA